MIRTRALTLLGMFVLAGALAGCVRTSASRPQVTREILDGRARNVKLISVSGPNGDLETFDHPVSFTTEDMPTLLSQFTVRKKGARTWLEPQALFTDAEIRGMARPLAEAFREATTTEYIAFKYSHRIESLLLPKYEISAGTMFVRDNQLHLRLEYFHEDPESVGVITYRAPGVEAQRALQIETGPNQQYVLDPGSGKVSRQWVAMDWSALETKLTASRKARARRIAARQRAMEDRGRDRAEPGGDGWETLEEPEPQADVYFPE